MVGLLRGVSAVKCPILERAASINWTTTAGWHRATLTKPLLILPNTKFFLSFTNPGKLPYMTAGPDTVQHWHSGPSWRGPYSARWNYNILCCGQATGAIPVLGNVGVPSISTPFRVTLDKAIPNRPALLILGFSDQSWLSIPLPLDLTPAGANGCSLLTGFEFANAIVSDASGQGSFQYAFPNDKNLIGVVFYNQFGVFDSPANSLGLVFSNGAKGTLGS